MTRVLVVEDDPQLVRALVINMQARQYGVDAAPDGAAALRLAAARQPDVVMLDQGPAFRISPGPRGLARTSATLSSVAMAPP